IALRICNILHGAGTRANNDAGRPRVRSSASRSRALSSGARYPMSVRRSGSENKQIPTINHDTVGTVLAAARAASTNRKYKSVISRYESLLSRMGMSPWPVCGSSLAVYISALTQEGRVQYTTIKDYVQKLRCANTLEHGRLSEQDSELVRLALLGASKILGVTSPKRARTLSKKGAVATFLYCPW
ncbi:hypothetical protein Pmar_PMAR029365, partial [Perkinsus marinus ATCC 50983]